MRKYTENLIGKMTQLAEDIETIMDALDVDNVSNAVSKLKRLERENTELKEQLRWVIKCTGSNGWKSCAKKLEKIGHIPPTDLDQEISL